MLPVPARLIVCERSTRWAIALRRELAGSGVRVWETRTLDDCRSELLKSPASFVVLELHGNIVPLLRTMERGLDEFPMMRMGLVADRSWEAYQTLMLEAGAVLFLSSPRKVGVLARLASRHLLAAPLPQEELTERIWNSLPWANAKPKS